MVSATNVLGANEKLGIGYIGVGGRGSSHVWTVKKLIESGEQANIVAVCDAYGYRREEAARATGAKIYTKHHELLADKNVDVVCIATPDRLHVPQAMDAIRAGKDVYCEKPMGHWARSISAGNSYEEKKLRGSSRWATRPIPAPLGSRFGPSAKGTIGHPQHIQAGYYRYGDWGERMPIPDRHAKPGPDLDWDAFLGDAPKVPFTVTASSVGGNISITPAVLARTYSPTC